MRRLYLTCGLLAAIGFLPTCACAQLNMSGSGFGGSGGSSGLGGMSSGMGSSGLGSSSGFGSSGFGSAGGMSGGLGSGGLGSSGMGGLGGQSGMGGLGQNQQGGGFLGRNANQQQFLGGNTQGQNQNQGRGTGMNGMMNQFGNTNRGNRGNMNTMNSLFGNGNSNGSGNNNLPVIRPRQKIAFDYPVPKPEALQSTLQIQLTKVSVKHPSLSNVMVSTNPGGEVVMRGVVKSEADARLAANLMRLEPGVRTVRNELTFPPVDATAE